jgi:hypothetical protein
MRTAELKSIIPITSSSDGSTFDEPQWTTGFDPDDVIQPPPTANRPDHVFLFGLKTRATAV